MDLISRIRESYPDEKVIIVSNFLASLDAIKNVCKAKNWNCMRIDGSVDNDRRMKIVQYFNKPVQPKQVNETNEEVKKRNTYFILLLSAKAGGVGLNLIGANRLILMDPDWNPATDQQAMARIYREGQKREVFIYRLISKNTIEEVILQRQYLKGKLSVVVQENQMLPEGSKDDQITNEDKEPEDDNTNIHDFFSSNATGINSILHPDENILNAPQLNRVSTTEPKNNQNEADCLSALSMTSSTSVEVIVYKTNEV